MPRCEAVSKLPGMEWQCERETGHVEAHRAHDPQALPLADTGGDQWADRATRVEWLYGPPETALPTGIIYKPEVPDVV